MAGPWSPDPTQGIQQDRRLNERASFVGSAGRQAKSLDREQNEAFGQMLEEGMETKESRELSPEEMEASKDAAERLRAETEAPQDDNAMTTAELETFQRDQSLLEGKRRGTWRGPTPIIGLSVASGQPGHGVAGLQHASDAQTSARAEKQNLSTQNSSKVDPALLQALKTSGLDEPLTGLEDPRLAAHPIPLQNPWKELTLDGGIGFFWSSGLAHQKLELREGFKRLETAAGTMVQTIEGHGKVLESRTERRQPPDPRKFDLAASQEQPISDE